MDIAGAVRQGGEQLARSSDSPRLDVELLLCHLLGKPRSYLFTWPEQVLDAQQLEAFAALLARRESGEPVAHILGRREFWSLALTVSADTLIPRPETELLVEVALARIPEQAHWRMADLGTGSGAIALALASERPRCRITAVERSEAALAVAQDNVRRLGLENVVLRQGSWFEPLAGERFALIVSNPPYIPEGDPHLAQGDLRFEPKAALSAGADGLEDIRHLIAHAPEYLEAGGWLLLEHGYDQGDAVVALLRERGYEAVEDVVDLLGHGRVALGRYRGEPPSSEGT
ncbi:MAG: peptide chain release factor N(5)-glutamine methyltransferase [Pseudomonadota bacterium]